MFKQKKEWSRCSLCKCELDKVRQMIMATQNTPPVSSRPWVTHAFPCKKITEHSYTYAHTFTKLQCVSRKSLQRLRRTSDPRSHRRCRLASSLVSIPSTPDAFLSLHLSGTNRPPAQTLSPQRIYGPAPWSSLPNCPWP